MLEMHADMEFPPRLHEVAARRFLFFDSVMLDLYPACAEEMYSD
jgi:hypothetical protein